MSKNIRYRVPDVLDRIYDDVVLGLYSPDYDKIKDNRIIIAKCNIACEYLLKGSRSEEEIVAIVDFPSVEIFRDTFRDFLGIYPLEFRDRFS